MIYSYIKQKQAPRKPEASASPDFDPGLIRSVAKLSSVMNARDPRCDFMQSLKPLLSPDSPDGYEHEGCPSGQ